jgi:hypothetical protein
MAEWLNTRELDPEDNWAFFSDRDAPVAAADRARIRALDESSARRAWDHVVRQRVPATVVARGGWISDLSDPFVWQDAWQDRDEAWAERTLRPALGWSDDEAVLFVERPARALATQFAVFVRAWRAFLLDDNEGPLLVSLDKPEVAWFHPSGNGLLGQRPIGPEGLVIRPADQKRPLARPARHRQPRRQDRP